MDLKQLSDMQLSMDERHGFPVKFDNASDTYAQLTKELVGLFGEIGEFANIVKKVNIKLDRPQDYSFDLDAAKDNLSEELSDSLIYIIRIAAMLEIDLESEVVRKIRLNESRYAQLRKE